MVGGSVELRCPAQGGVINLFEWFDSDGGLINSTGRFNITEEDNGVEDVSILTIYPVEAEDQGLYTCLITTDIITVNDTILLVVSPKGVVTIEPSFIKRDYGDTHNFTCSTEGGPFNTFSWTVNNELSTIMNTTFSISSVSAEDGGEYVCRVDNFAGSGSATATLYVSPRITINPVTEVNTTVGSELLALDCLAEAFPAPTYKWTKLTGPSSPRIVGNSSTLLFPQIEFGDEGTYLCTVSSYDWDVNSTLSTIHVSPSGSVSVSPRVINSTSGTMVTFTCEEEGGLNNVIDWRYSRTGEVVSNTSTLTLTSSASIGGDYQCEVSNQAGFDRATGTLNVAPAILVKPEDTYVTYLTESIQLHCTVSGFPVPEVSWQFGTDVYLDASIERVSIYSMPNSSFGEDTVVLEISMARLNETGSYTCVASSPYFDSVESEPAQVIVQAAPEPPQNVAVVDVTETSVTLSWTMPEDNNAPILGYRISYYLPEFSGEDIVFGEEVIVNVSEREAQETVMSLHPFVNYTFTVTAFNEIGDSERSDAVSVLTNESAPTAPPSAIQVDSVDPSTIRLTWDVVPLAYRNGIVDAYVVTYNSCLNSTSVERRVTQLSYTLTGPLELTTYTFSVRAVVTTENGDDLIGPFDYVSIFHDFPPPPMPEPVPDAAITPTSATITWMAPPGNITIIRYDLRLVAIGYRLPTLDEGPARRQIETNSELQTCLSSRSEAQRNRTIAVMPSSSVVSFNVTDLLPFVVYSFSVQATSRVGSGDFSDSQTFETDFDAPDPVVDLSATTRDSTSLLVIWNPPNCPNGPISGYHVYYTLGTQPQSQPINSSGYESLFTTQTKIVIEGLLATQSYLIHVRAVATFGNASLMGDAGTEVVQVVNTTTATSSSFTDPGVSTITISLPRTDEYGGGDLVYYGVIVVEDPQEMLQPQIEDFVELYPNPQPYDENSDVDYYITAAWNFEEDVPGNFTVGDKSTVYAVRNGVNESYFNAALKRYTSYCIYAEVQTRTANEVITRVTELSCLDTRLGYNTAGLIVGLLLALLIIFLLILIIICYFYCHYKKSKREKYGTYIVTKEPLAAMNSTPEFIELEHYPVVNEASKRLSAEDFPALVMKMHGDNGYLFTEEFTHLDPSEVPTSIASAANKAKNKYSNIVAYDHSRVLLEDVEDTVGSDYINANYINGYNEPKAFIAAQGPLVDTVEDFWRMAWEQNAPIIVMLTKLEERDKIKCHRYWPEEGQLEEYGIMKVHFQSEVVNDDYVLRTFNVQREGVSGEKIVKQFHYTEWPDFGVPKNGESFMFFVKMLMKEHQPDVGPMIVHCSAGVGRTGTLIALYTQMQRLRSEQTVDIYTFVKGMRKDRNNMVQTEAEYVFIYDALANAMEKGVI